MFVNHSHTTQTLTRNHQHPLARASSTEILNVANLANLSSYGSIRIENRNRSSLNVKIINNNVTSTSRPATIKAAVMAPDRLDIGVNARWPTLWEEVVLNGLKVLSSQGGVDAQVDIRGQDVLEPNQKHSLLLGSFSRVMDINELV